MKSYFALLLLTVCSCSTWNNDSFKHDLLGKTTGAGEKSWHFHDPRQIVSLNVLERTNNVASFSHIPKLGSLEFDRRRTNYVVLEMELHDLDVAPSFYVQTLLTYRHGRLLHVGLLGIEQLDPVR